MKSRKNENMIAEKILSCSKAVKKKKYSCLLILSDLESGPDQKTFWYLMVYLCLLINSLKLLNWIPFF